MAKIVVSENVTLDGVAQDPTGDEGFKRGGWFNRVGDRDFEQWAKLELDEALGAEALLLGRRSDEWFATRWSSRTGQWADRLNSLPKYVVSSTRAAPAWTNSTVLTGDALDEIAKLKRELAGNIVVYASLQLVQTLMEHDFVDEVRLTIHPVVLGAGQRLFADVSDTTALRLVHAQTVGESLVHLTYQRASA